MELSGALSGLSLSCVPLARTNWLIQVQLVFTPLFGPCTWIRCFPRLPASDPELNKLPRQAKRNPLLVRINNRE